MNHILALAVTIALCVSGCAASSTAKGTLANVYVSNVVANGINVGNDSTGDGSMSKPYKSVQKGLSEVSSGGALHLNGSATNPIPYQTTSGLLVSSPTNSITIEAIVAGTVTIQATASMNALLEINGSNVVIDGVYFDGNNYANTIVLTDDSASVYTVSMDINVLLKNPISYGISGGPSQNNINLTFNGAIVGSNMLSGISYPKFCKGSIVIDGTGAAENSSVTVTAQTSPPTGDVGIFANIIGVSGISGSGCTGTPTGTLVINKMNVAGTIAASGGVGKSRSYFLILVSGVNGAKVTNSTSLSMSDNGQGYGCRIIVYNSTPTAGTYSNTDSNPMNNAAIENNVITHNCAGGGDHILIGYEDIFNGSSTTYPISNTTVSSNMMGVGPYAVGVEPLLIGFVTSTIVKGNTCNDTSWCILFKGTQGTSTATGNLANNITTAGMDQKSGVGNWESNTVVSASSGSGGALCLKVEPDIVGGVTVAPNSSIPIFTGNACFMRGTGDRYIYAADNNQVITYSTSNGTNYYKGSNVLNSSQTWYYPLIPPSSFVTLESWVAQVEHGAVCNPPTGSGAICPP